MEEDIRKLHEIWKAHLEARIRGIDNGPERARAFAFLEEMHGKYSNEEGKQIIDKVFWELLAEYNLIASA